MQEVKQLNSHKKVLIDRYAEELLLKQKLQKENDSLKKALEERPPVFRPDTILAKLQ